MSLQEAIAALNQSQFNAMERTGEVRRQATTAASNPTVALLPASDGWVAISPREEHQWARWLTVMGNPAWGEEPRFATRRSRAEHWPALHALLAEWSSTRPRLEIFEAAQASRVACYPLGVPTDLLASPQLAARGFFQDAPGLPGLRVPGRPYRIETSEKAGGVPSTGPPGPAAVSARLHRPVVMTGNDRRADRCPRDRRHVAASNPCLRWPSSRHFSSSLHY